ncbi:MAG TPA: nitrilase-related carbon-nitrogen hydrolase [Anaerolineae bacterium]|nr:nitrilase-related carbon-nitrogen hydrolase [Anaerolineae bacterium]
MQTRVSAVQLEFRYCSTPQEFADHVRAPIERAAQDGAQLIVLPHTASYMLFGMFDTDARANETFDDLAQRQNLSTHEWLADRAGYVFEFYLHLFQSLAARVETWLVPGTVIEPEDENFLLTAFLLNPSGEIVGRQRQMHNTEKEHVWGILPGDTLRVFETEIGDFGIVTGEDIHYPEVARILASNGANALLHPAAHGAATHNVPPNEQLLQDLWRDVQANQTFGVQANLVGANFYGLSAIYAPIAYHGERRGILAQADTTSDEVVSAELDVDALKLFRAQNVA